MERSRGTAFALVAGLLSFAWMLPIVLEDARSSGAAYLVIEPAASLLAFVGLSLLCFFSGRWIRSLFKLARSAQEQ
jgi:hypothetical protein